MPPQISDEEASVAGSSDAEEVQPVATKGRGIKDEKTKKEEGSQDENELFNVESDNGESNDDDQAEDEYVVEKITNHFVDEETGEIHFEIKWEGYDKKSDRTWEPEENLETAKKIHNEYLAQFGGRDAIIEAWKSKKAESTGTKGKKRRRPSISEDRGLPKRGRKCNGAKAASETPPASGEFKPPTGSWEDEVVAIDACEGAKGKVVVYLTWRGGQKSQHPLAQIYKRCPQKMLQFYESHLVFKPLSDP